MSRTQRHIKSQATIINEVSYADSEKPTNAAIITEKTMETNEKTKSVRQESKAVYNESKLAKNKKTERQEKKTGAGQIMENKAISYAS